MCVRARHACGCVVRREQSTLSGGGSRLHFAPENIFVSVTRPAPQEERERWRAAEHAELEAKRRAQQGTASPSKSPVMRP